MHRIALCFIVIIIAGSTPSGSAGIETFSDSAPPHLAVADGTQAPRAPTNLRILRPGEPSSFVPGPAPAPSGDHAYFDALAARSDVLMARSLRSQAQLDALVKVGPSSSFTYDPGSGATKLYHLPKPVGSTESIPGNQQLRFPLAVSDGSVLVTWDFWWGAEFKTNLGTLDVFKSFRVNSGTNIEGTDIFWSLNDNFVKATAAEDVSVHQEDLGDGLNLAPGVESEKPYSPTGASASPSRTFPTKLARWTRYWLEVRLNVPGSEFTEWSAAHLGGTPLTGSWAMCSLWIADEGRDPQRVIYRAPAAVVGSMLTDFRFLFNTSTNSPALAGPVVGYARDVVILRNAAVNESDKVLFQRPKP
jgi:hypothetical protein